MTDKVRKSIVPRWRVSGEVEIRIDDANIKMFSNCDDSIVDNLFYNANNYSEIEELKLFGKLAARSKMILDVGANTGFYSVFSSAKNPESEIWAFEPYSSNSARLKHNLSINDSANVKVFEKAVGSGSENIMISVPDSGQICDSVSADAEFSNRFYRETVTYKEIEVEQVRLDDLEYKTQVDLIKIDVENYELAVLQGALKTFEKMSPVIQCEMISIDESRADFYQNALKPLSYNCYLMLKNGLLFSEHLTENPDGRDFLFTRKKLENNFTAYRDENLASRLIS